MGDCGSSECMREVGEMCKRVSDDLGKRHDIGIASIKELMAAHHNQLAGEINEFKRNVEKDALDLWPRLRCAESDIKVLQTTITPDLDAKIKKVSQDNLDVRSLKTLRLGWKEIVVIVSAALLLNALSSFLPPIFSGKESKTGQLEAPHKIQTPGEK